MLPTVSSDGKRIAYQLGGRVWFGSSEMPLQIPKITRVAQRSDLFGSQWAPTHDEVLVLGRDAPTKTLPAGGPAGIFITGYDEFRPARMSKAPFPGGHPLPQGIATWSPNGKQIAYQALSSNADASPWGTIRVHEVAARTTKEFPLNFNLLPAADDRALHWSQDGKYLSFAQSRERLNPRSTSARAPS